MTRTDRASREIAADPSRIYDALVDPDALVVWLPPAGMSGRFERFDPRPGGGYRLVLTYLDPSGSPGKTTGDADVVDARFVELDPGVRVVQEADFVSDDAAYAGTMRMTWSITPAGDASMVEVVADDVPDGISAEDHAVGLASSLDNLAVFVEESGAEEGPPG